MAKKKKKYFKSTIKFNFLGLLSDKELSIKDFARLLEMKYGAVQKMVSAGQALPKRIRLVPNILRLDEYEIKRWKS
ncbi:MAG: hypothetical protein PHS34_09250 [Candidatus Omnitrophica bacterium]|nr:hypothetical protein [Candidatus Omnitrophota bacterium]